MASPKNDPNSLTRERTTSLFIVILETLIKLINKIFNNETIRTVWDKDDEKYWYWKPYFDFSFNELGVKLVCLSYYYKKYFLPIHLNIHSTSLGYRVFANNIKLTNTLHIIENQPSIMLNDKNEVIFKGNGIHYFTKQIHYIDEYFNEFNLGNLDIENDIREWYYINDTCVNIPISFKTNEVNKGYFNCVLLLQKQSNNEVLYESHFNFNQNNNKIYHNFIIYPKKLNVIVSKNNVETKYFEYWVNNDFRINLLVNNKWYTYDFKLKIHNPTIDFGTLKYRYYFNDHNYLFSKIINNNTNNIHNIVFCGTEDIDKIQNKKINEYKGLFITPNIFNNHILGIPENYTCYLLDSTFIKEKDEYDNDIDLSWSINWDFETENKTCYLYEYINDKVLNINNASIYNEQIKYINIENQTLLICPNDWGTPLFIKNDLKKINEYIYYTYKLNNVLYDEWNQNTWIQSFNLNEAEYIYQFFKENYNLLSPFKQIRHIDNEHNKIIFNSYMHNKQLVNMNDINFDINFSIILKYHLEHNLLYIDGTLTDGEFYQYIICEDIMGNPHEVYIHKDLIGYDISFFADYLNNNDKILLCAYKGNIFILSESAGDSNNENNYTTEIINVVLTPCEDRLITLLDNNAENILTTYGLDCLGVDTYWTEKINKKAVEEHTFFRKMSEKWIEGFRRFSKDDWCSVLQNKDTDLTKYIHKLEDEELLPVDLWYNTDIENAIKESFLGYIKNENQIEESLFELWKKHVGETMKATLANYVVDSIQNPSQINIIQLVKLIHLYVGNSKRLNENKYANSFYDEYFNRFIKETPISSLLQFTIDNWDKLHKYALLLSNDRIDRLITVMDQRKKEIPVEAQGLPKWEEYIKILQSLSIKENTIVA